MKAVRHRDLCLPLSTLVSRGGTAQATPELEKSKRAVLTESEVLSPDQLPVTVSANGRKSWDVLQGVLATGEAIAVHESLQPAGIAPNPPHAIQHSELILVQQGTLLFEYDGRSEKVGPGGVIFVALGTKHAARNVGDGPASYLVVAIGGDTR